MAQHCAETSAVKWEVRRGLGSVCVCVWRGHYFTPILREACMGRRHLTRALQDDRVAMQGWRKRILVMQEEGLKLAVFQLQKK